MSSATRVSEGDRIVKQDPLIEEDPIAEEDVVIEEDPDVDLVSEGDPVSEDHPMPGDKTGGLPVEERVRQRAHRLYLSRGERRGSELEDWLQAEEEVRLEDRRQAAEL